MMEEIINKFIEKNYLVSPSLIKKYRRESLLEILEKLPTSKELKVLKEDDLKELMTKPKNKEDIKIIFSYDPSKYKLLPKTGWHLLFYNKYTKLKEILLKKMRYSSSIDYVKKKTNGEFQIIGMVYDIIKTKNNKIILQLDDPTGFVNVLIPDDLKEIANRITLDEVIGIKGVKLKKDMLVAKEIFFPSYTNKNPNRANEDVYALIIGDIHVGSKNFLKRVVEKLVKWIDLRDYYTDRQKSIIEKIKYVIFNGDLVDGIGIYPEQKDELEISDIYKQYQEFADLFKINRDDIYFITIPGNHDGIRLSEPQPPFDGQIKEILSEIPNNIIVSNPSYLKLDNVDFLLYHGYSVDYYINNVPAIMQGYEYPRIYMEWFLEKSHLNPTHGAIPIAPLNEDLLVMDKHFDVLIMAHTHRKDVYYSNRHNVLLISTACLQAKTKFQEKVGHKPTPGYVILLNLKTFHTTILDLIPPATVKKE